MLQPLISDYKQAVLDAANSFKDLLPIRPILQQGEPKFAAGNFAVVFQVQKTDTEQLLAVKCFHRALPDRQERQQHIAAYLATHRPRYFVPYRYLHEELWVDTGSHAQDYPVVVMDWVEGKTLGETVKNYCQEGNTDALKDLLMKFCEMASYLLSLPIAHGDLKHDNILVTPAGELLLVDYDGMYVRHRLQRPHRRLRHSRYCLVFGCLSPTTRPLHTAKRRKLVAGATGLFTAF
jgi:hypothetical protein